MPKKKTGLNKVCCMLMGLLLLSCAALAQRTVTGKVINKTDQQPVRNATVQVRGTVIAAQTDSSGNFSIEVPKNGTQLEITSVGYENALIPIAGKTNIGEVQLAVTVGNLNEVFVTGYTSQRKKDITAAVSIVNVADLKATPSGSTEALLQGQASGVTVVTSGAPGAPAVVNIRGITSSGNSAPLVLIDGVPGSMHDINANDIQSLQILKDAGGAAIYGVRGSNGIIVITTRKGTGPPKDLLRRFHWKSAAVGKRLGSCEPDSNRSSKMGTGI